MNSLLRRVGFFAAGLAALLLLAALVVYVLSERELRRSYDIRAVSLAVPTDSAAIGEGRRLAIVHGCFNGCHGKQAEGVVFFDAPWVGHVVAPDLTRAVSRMSDAELAVTIRQGVRPDGRSMLVMPSESFVVMRDDDLARILAFLHSLPASNGLEPGMSLGPLGRIGLVAGQFKTAARMIEEAAAPPEAANDEAAQGRYLARTVCAQCHGTGLRGATFPEFTSPSLQMVAAYSPEDFARLLRTGTALGGREVGLMSEWARTNLSSLTDAEIAALYAYLHSLP